MLLVTHKLLLLQAILETQSQGELTFTIPLIAEEIVQEQNEEPVPQVE